MRTETEKSEQWRPGPNPNCKKCCTASGPAGWVYANVPPNHPMYGKAVPCGAPGCYAEQWDNRATIKHKMDAQVGRAFTLDTFQGRDKYAMKMIRAAADLLSNARRWCLIYGKTGTGKTHWLRAMEAEFRRRGRPVIYREIADWLSAYWAAVKAEEGPEFLQQAKDIDVLIWDDLKLEQLKDTQYSRLEEVLSARYGKGLTTLMATNADIAALPQRLQSRFGDQQFSISIENQGTDYRLQRGTGVR